MNAEWEQWDVQEKTARENKRRIEGSEPKADPKEKELYSIKELEWTDINSIDAANSELTIIGRYSIVKYQGGHMPMLRLSDLDWNGSTCKSRDEAKQAAQDHFNSKLKLCLNREL